MSKLNSIADFKKLLEEQTAVRSTDVPTIVIPAGTCGQASGANDLMRIAKRELIYKRLTDYINLRITGCHGYCELEPSVLVEPYRTFYPKVTIEGMVRIVGAVHKGEVVTEMLYTDPDTGERIEKQGDIPFFKNQVRSLLSQNEKIDPIRILQYIGIGGYSAFIKVLERGDPRRVIEEIKTSGLRGRGGAGFPTGLKWEFLADRKNGRKKYLVCNADEGDPGAYMDRSLLEGNPHSIMEGMLIGAYATGATNGIIYVRNEYPLAIKHLIIAIRRAYEIGLFGEDVLGSGFTFDIDIAKGAGAFVCGEETALIKSIEGKMGEPRQRPPFPVEKGINGKPTVINNVETWANIPSIIEQGAKKFAQTGTANNTGTKIFSLVGKVQNTGLVEVPMGISLKDIIFGLGGGSPGRTKIKAVQTGGPSGGCIPVSKFDLPIDYDSLAQAGSIMGSGGMIVMDEHTCMVDVAKYYTKFLMDESCGKCFTCREGIRRMHELLEDISTGKATLETLSLLKDLAAVVKDTTMCGLGQTASNPVLSTIHYFENEYLEHINDKRCRAYVCNDLTGAPCHSACPLGTEAWRYVAHIARGEYDKAYRAIRESNPFPSVCARVCNHPCEEVCRAGLGGGEPVAIRALKRFVTDTIDPASYKPTRKYDGGRPQRIAVVGSGPAGLTAAHYLSLKGYKVTVFEKEAQPGGMLSGGIPEYRLPRETLQKEINSLLDENINLKCNKAIGKDFTIDDLFTRGYDAVFLAMGAHKSKLLDIEGEDLDGVYPAIEFLKRFNFRGESLARGRVGVIGGGDSAVDAARVSLREKGVESVTMLYRRSRSEMPALYHEVDAAIEEGVKLVTMVSPVKIHSEKGRLSGVEVVKNRPGDVDESGRKKPVIVPGSEYIIPFDTLIVTIGDTPDVGYIASMGINVSKWGTLEVNEHTLMTNKPGVFAGGDVVTGPNTVVEAIAHGKKAAVMIDRYVNGKELRQSEPRRIPSVYIPPPEVAEEDTEEQENKRITLPTIPVYQRKRSLTEVELTLMEEQAVYEARRCLRCDLEFTDEKSGH
jgi:NADH-quinone oxidoreductase subunit F